MFCLIFIFCKNLRTSDRVLPRKAYDIQFDMSYTMVLNGVLGGDT